MTIDNLLYTTGAAFDVWGALLISQGFYNIKDDDIKDFSANKICAFSQGRAKSIIKQRYEAMFGGGFIVSGSVWMLLASIFSFLIPPEQYPNIFVNKPVTNYLGVFSVCVAAILYFVSYKYIIEYLSKKKLSEILDLKEKPDTTENDKDMGHEELQKENEKLRVQRGSLIALVIVMLMVVSATLYISLTEAKNAISQLETITQNLNQQLSDVKKSK